MNIGVVDHGAGNLVSITRGLERAGARVLPVLTSKDFEDLDGIVLPGVGATAHVMDGIRQAGMEASLREPQAPMLGICVGMQVLFDGSDEDDARCLELIPGRVRRLVAAPRLPHIGWNTLTIERPDPVLDAIGGAPDVYFVHSYAPEPEDPSCVIATATHGRRFVAAVRSGSISGTQFHPERSGTIGMQILANFVNECKEAAQ